MTFVGKVLVAVQLVLSVSFMTFAAAVYSVQTSWKNSYEELRGNLDSVENQQLYDNLKAQGKANVADLVKEIANRQAEFQARNDELAQQLADAEQQIGRLQAQNETLKQDLAQVEQQLEDERALHAREQASAEVFQVEAEYRETEAERQRTRNDKLLADRNRLVKQVRQLEDEQYANEKLLQRYRQRYRTLLAENSALKGILRKNELSTDPSNYEQQQSPPPEVEGLVLRTRRGSQGALQFVEISVGSDDGLDQGHQLYVYRTEDGGKYLGKIDLVHVEPDRAVGTIVERAKNGNIQRGDNVTTKL